jgi:hypothetical protein
VKRREFIRLLCGAALVGPLAARGQQAVREVAGAGGLMSYGTSITERRFRGEAEAHGRAWLSTPDSIWTLDLRWNNDTVQVVGLPIEFQGCTDMKAEIRCRLFQDFARRNGYPRAIDFHLVVIIDLSP